MCIKVIVVVFLILTGALTGCGAQRTATTALKQSNEISNCTDNLPNEEVEMQIGDSIYDVRNQAKDIVLDCFTLLAFRESEHSAIVIADGEHITGIAEFSDEGILTSSNGLVPIEMPEMDEIFGMTIEEVVATYGEIHTDIGSGRYIPAYVTNRGTVILLHLEDNVVTSAYECEIWTGAEKSFGDILPIEVI